MRLKTKQVFDRKKAVAEMAELDPEFAAQVRTIHDEPEMVVLNEKISSLEKQLKDVRGKIYEHRGEIESIIRQYDSQADAEALLRGEALQDQSRDTNIQNLRRQEQAFARAIEILIDERRMLEQALIKRNCEKLRPLIMPFLVDTIKALENVQKFLENQEKLWAFLSHKGYTANFRPAGWQPAAGRSMRTTDPSTRP